MGFSERLENGWTLTKTSFSVLKKNKQLIFFPIMSGLSLLLVIGTFVTGMLASNGWDVDRLFPEESNSAYYFYLFIYYIINYFVIVFFNMALIHCVRLYFQGEEPTIRSGINFSLSRMGAIF